MNDVTEWVLWRIRGLDTHVPPPLAAPIQRTTERLVARSPTALSIFYQGTDKGLRAEAQGHLYTDHYRRFFGPTRTRPLTLLEIGVGNGGSLRLWRRFLPKAKIVGIDLHLPDLELPGVEMHEGDQSDEDFLASLASHYGGFDIVIDDGSHVGRHVRASFRALFPAVRPGGWYVVEDLQTSYWETHEGGSAGTPGTAVELIKGMVDRTQTEAAVYDAAELHVFDGIAFIRKTAEPFGTPRPTRLR